MWGRIAAVLLATLAATTARAGNISISITPTISLQDGTLTAQVQVRNGGDEAAHSVSPILLFGDQQARGTALEDLAPGQTTSAPLTLPVGNLGPGRWLFRVAVDYADANAYPFQALHAGLFSIANPPPAKVSVSHIDAPPVSRDGSIGVQLKNLAGVARQAAVRVAVPDGIEVSAPVHTVALDAWGEAKTSVPIVNRTALPGSRYPVFVAAEYDDEGVHQTALTSAIIEIQAPRNFFQAERSLLWIAGGVLVAAWLLFLVWQFASRRPRRATPGA
jgi:hypothetical protein